MASGQFSAGFASRFRPGSRRRELTDPAAIISQAKPQTNSHLMQLPFDIREQIFQQVWLEVGSSQHVIFENGRFARAPCVTDHTSTFDSRLVECAALEDWKTMGKPLYRQMISAWGNHWKCEEFHQTGSRPSPLFALLLTCRQLYVECLVPVLESLKLVVHDLNTLYKMTTSLPTLLGHLRHLQLTIHLPLVAKGYHSWSLKSRIDMAHWRYSCEVLDSLAYRNLRSVDLWLDTTIAKWRACLCSVGLSTSNPFLFNERLAGILTVNLPVNEDKPETWQSIADLQPRFAVRPRSWPIYRPEEDSFLPGVYQRWYTGEQPGFPYEFTRASMNPERRSGLFCIL